MKCRKFKSCIPKYYDGDLATHEKDELSQHAKECLTCRREFYQMDKLKELLPNIDIFEPSADFNFKLWARVQKEKYNEGHEKAPELNLTLTQKIRWALATSLVTIVMLSAIVLTDPRFSLLVKEEPKSTQITAQSTKHKILVEPDKVNYVMDKYKPLPRKAEVDNPGRDKEYNYVLERRAYPQLITTGEQYVLPVVSIKSLIEESY
ncbi:MAG: zf-HC2 domain-containing protein [candidate division Zixibacteria bacterium]|nr:zf-HC2 domain-containing protein [candidate division Zixibacteria bacterium]